MRYPLTQPALVGALVLAGATLAHAQDLTNAGTQLTVGSGALLTVPGTLTNQAGATLTLDGTLQVGGNLTNAGTVAPGTGTVVFVGTTDQTLTPGGATLPSVEVRNTGPTGQNRVLLPADLTISQQLTLTSGLLRTAAATLHLPASATLTGEASGRYVQGNLEVTRTTVQGTTAIDFGNGVLLNPNGSSLGTVHVTRAAGLQTAGTSYGVNPGNSAQKGIDRIWTIVADQPPATTASLTFSWLPDDDNGLSNFTQAQVWRMPDNSTAWQPAGPQADASGRSITASTSAFSRWTVSNAANPLPVTLTSFTAQRQGEDALLQWATTSELHNDHFEVEVGTDGLTFSRIGTVAGHGTTSQPRQYQLPDHNLTRYASNVVYYRLRQVDTDGTATYSPVRSVYVATGVFAVEAFPSPTPAGQGLNLLVHTPRSGAAALQVGNVLGQILLQQSLVLPEGSTTIELPQAAHWASGVYLLQVRQGNQQQLSKVVRE